MKKVRMELVQGTRQIPCLVITDKDNKFGTRVAGSKQYGGGQTIQHCLKCMAVNEVIYVEM